MMIFLQIAILKYRHILKVTSNGAQSNELAGKNLA